MKLSQLTEEGPEPVDGNAFDFFVPLWNLAFAPRTFGPFGTHGRMVHSFNRFQHNEAVPDYQKIATSFLSSYLIVEQEGLEQTADAIQRVRDELGGTRSTDMYDNLVHLLQGASSPLLFGTHMSEEGIVFRDGCLRSLDELREVIPISTEIPITWDVKDGKSNFYSRPAGYNRPVSVPVQP